MKLIRRILCKLFKISRVQILFGHPVSRTTPAYQPPSSLFMAGSDSVRDMMKYFYISEIIKHNMNICYLLLFL